MIKKIFYYFRTFLFIFYLIIMFLLIDKIFKPNFFSTMFFILNLFYSIIIISTIISKKKVFKESYSHNILNIGFYSYIFMLYKIVVSNTSLDILNNEIYFRNNYVMLGILLIGLILFSLSLNNSREY